jgi:serine/threonine protein kinase
VGPLPEFVSQKLGKSRIWADSGLLASVGSELLANPDQLFGRTECQVIKDQRKTKVVRLTLKIGRAPVGVYLKRYNAFSVRYRVASLITASGALKSLRGAEILSNAGISTGKPLAAIELRSWGMLESSFFLTAEIVRGKTADAYWRENLMPLNGVEAFRQRRRFLKNLAKLFSHLHRSCIYHNDLKDANILVDANPPGDEGFFLLDLEGVRLCRYVNRRRRVKNLVQLNRTLGKFLTRTEKVIFLIAYLGKIGADRLSKRRWVSAILRATRTGDRRSLVKTASDKA